MLNDLAASQYGLVSLAQARQAGLPERTFIDLAMRQRWSQPHRGVYRLPGSWPTALGRLSAALLAVGEPALVGGWSAAWLLGMVRSAPSTAELVVPHDRRARSIPGVTVRRSRTLTATDAEMVAGLPATNAVRTVCDLSALTDEQGLRVLLIDGRQRRLLDLAAVVERASTMGTRRGLSQLRRLAWELDGERCDSILEYRLRARLHAVPGLPAPDPGPVAVDVGGRVLHVDIGWSAYAVGIEADGFGSHSERDSLEVDARRHNALERAGWRILRAGWSAVGPGFDDLLRDLTALLTQMGAPTAVSRSARTRLNGGGVAPWR